MNLPAIPASDPLLSLHPDDNTPALAILQGNGTAADDVSVAREEDRKRKLLSDSVEDAVTPEELMDSKRRLHAVRTRDSDVQYGSALPLGNDGAAFLAAVTEALATQQDGSPQCDDHCQPRSADRERQRPH
jgi:hypothetical protein